MRGGLKWVRVEPIMALSFTLVWLQGERGDQADPRRGFTRGILGGVLSTRGQTAGGGRSAGGPRAEAAGL